MAPVRRSVPHRAHPAGPRHDLDPALTEAGGLPDPRTLLRRYGIRPSKRLGQHFLTSRSHLAAIVEAAEVRPTDIVLEIGPGLGVLTHALAQAGATVVAVEIDPRMRAVLADEFGNNDRITIVAADVLNAAPAELAGLPPEPLGPRPGFLVVANLPYYITSAVLRHVLEADVKPERAVVMVQQEVAERIVAAPGNMSILAVAVQYYAQPRIVLRVPAAAFYPPPKVDSAVLRLEVHATPPVEVPTAAAFFRVVRAGFGQKRKQLRNSLASGLGLTGDEAAASLATVSIDHRRRAETLALDEWAALTRHLAESGRLEAP